MAKRHREYENSYPSMTQLLDQLRKVALEMWFKKNTLEFINTESKRGREIGTQLHQAIQDHIELNEVKIETEYPVEITNALKSFMLFKKECPSIKLMKSEIQLTSQKYGLNGTLDCLAFDGVEEAIADWKTGKCGDDIKPPIYDEYLFQVSGYTELYNEVNKACIKKAYIIVFAKDRVAYNIREVSAEEIKGSFENVILPLLTIWNFKHKEAVNV
jgi:ATP-dependent exoDNAse (exonuclease V) beta subunit